MKGDDAIDPGANFAPVCETDAGNLTNGIAIRALLFHIADERPAQQSQRQPQQQARYLTDPFPGCSARSSARAAWRLSRMTICAIPMRQNLRSAGRCLV